MADELGYYAALLGRRDLAQGPVGAVRGGGDKTERIRFGPNVTHVFLREPTLICQSLATLDELTGGRAEASSRPATSGCSSSTGSTGPTRSRCRASRRRIHVMRTFLDDGAITFEGDFFKYNGLYTFARPVQEQIPIKMGGMKGPRSFQHGGRDRRRPAPRAVVLPRGLRLRRRARPRWAPTRRAATSTTSTSAPGSSPSSPRTRRRPSARRASSSRSTSPRCRPSSSRATASTPPSSAGRRRARQRGHPEGRRAVPARVRREALARRHAGGVRGEDQGRHPADRASTT